MQDQKPASTPEPPDPRSTNKINPTTNAATPPGNDTCVITYAGAQDLVAKKLANEIQDKCKTSIILIDSSEKKDNTPEEFLKNIGHDAPLPVYMLIAIGILLPLIAIAISRRLRRSNLLIKTSGNQTKISYSDKMISKITRTANWLAKNLKTPTGMSIALLSGTAATCLLGVILVVLYSLSGVQHDFAQGSGSLVQAIWGSAATITAAVVAIMLALEAIKAADTTNKLQKEANNLSELQSPSFLFWQEIINFKMRIDNHAITTYKLFSHTNALITKEYAKSYEASLRDVYSLFHDILNSEAFVLLDRLPLTTLSDSREEDVIIREMHFGVDELNYTGNPKYYSEARCSDLAIQLRVFSDIALEAIDEAKDSESKHRILNALGRTHLLYMYSLKLALDYFTYTDIKDYTESKMILTEDAIDHSDLDEEQMHEKVVLLQERQKQQEIQRLQGLQGLNEKRIHRPSSRADDRMYELARLLKTKPRKPTDTDKEETEYYRIKLYLSEQGPAFLEKLKELVENETIPASTRGAAKKVLDENS